MFGSWRKLSGRNKVLSIVKNEITWGIFIILCAIITLIVWAANIHAAWRKYEDPIHEQTLMSIVGGIFAIVATLMSVIQIIQHVVHNSNKSFQKRIIRILGIVPAYALTALLSLIFLQAAIYMEFFQTCYEAYVLYCFLLLLTKYLGGHRGVEEAIESKEFIHLAFPFGYCYKPLPNPKWVWYFKIGILQYSWVAPICSGIAVVLNLAHVYGNGVWNFNQGYPYITIIINISQTLALYTLITFYLNMKTELKPYKPLAKFITIKLLVFFIFWQSVLMSGLAMFHVLKNTNCDPQVDISCHGLTTGFTVEKEKILFSNVLICVEMFFFAIAHHWIFSWKSSVSEESTALIESQSSRMDN